MFCSAVPASTGSAICTTPDAGHEAQRARVARRRQRPELQRSIGAGRKRCHRLDRQQAPVAVRRGDQCGLRILPGKDDDQRGRRTFERRRQQHQRQRDRGGESGQGKAAPQADGCPDRAPLGRGSGGGSIDAGENGRPDACRRFDRRHAFGQRRQTILPGAYRGSRAPDRRAPDGRSGREPVPTSCPARTARPAHRRVRVSGSSSRLADVRLARALSDGRRRRRGRPSGAPIRA